MSAPSLAPIIGEDYLPVSPAHQYINGFPLESGSFCNTRMIMENDISYSRDSIDYPPILDHANSNTVPNREVPPLLSAGQLDAIADLVAKKVRGEKKVRAAASIATASALRRFLI